MIEVILLVTVIIALFYYYAIKPMSYWTERGVKQGNPKWLFGDNFNTTFKIESFADMVTNVYNAAPGARYSGMYQMTTPVLLIRDVELIKQVGIKDFEHFVDHMPFIPEEADPLWGKNLFSLTGQRWRDMRPILSPSFTSSKMKAMFVLMTECAESFTNYFLNTDKDVIEVEMKDAFRRFANDVIASTAFGIKIDSMQQQDNDFYLMGKEVTDLSGFWKNFKFIGYLLFPKISEIFKFGIFDGPVRKFFTDIIDTTIKVREEKGIIRPDIIHLMMEARKGVQHKDEQVLDTGFAVVEEVNLGKKSGKDLTNMDITAQALGFFFAGFDSVSALMCFMLYELVVHPDIQKRLREEIEETLEECQGSLTYEAVLKMKYLDMVVSESLRKWPNAVGVDRYCTKPYTIPPVTPEEKPIHLKKGSVIWFPIFGIHRDPQYYPDPERFDPERFNDENKGNINPYAYIPFGVGPRNCLGSRFALLETKVVFIYLLANFEFVPNSKSKIPIEICKKQFNLTAESFWYDMKRIKK